MLFTYQGMNPDGQPCSGFIEADSVSEAAAKLSSQEGFVLIDLSEAGSKRIQPKFTSIRGRELVMLLSQMAYMLKAGISIIQGFEALGTDYHLPNIRNIFKFLIDELSSGSSLSQALRDTGAFPDMLSDLVSTGEETGQTDVMLMNYVTYIQEQEGYTRKMLQSMLYPVLVVLVLIAAVGFLSFAVFPKFIGFFEHSGVELPWITKALFNAISFSKKYVVNISATAASMVVGYLFMKRSEKFRIMVDRIKLNVPLYGHVERLLNMYNYLQTFFCFTEAG